MITDVPLNDYMTLLNEDILTQLEDLVITSKNLDDVALHCLNTYKNSLEQTFNCTAQALGSVAYKISMLATNFLVVLDHEHARLNVVRTKVNHLNMQVMIQQESAARLLVGHWSLPRECTSTQSPKSPIRELSARYQRKEIDFSALDNIGHGTKDAQLSTSTEGHTSPHRNSVVSGSGTGFETLSPTQIRGLSTSLSASSQRRGSEFSKYGRGAGISQLPGLSCSNTGGIFHGAPTSQVPMMSPNIVNTSSTPITKRHHDVQDKVTSTTSSILSPLKPPDPDMFNFITKNAADQSKSDNRTLALLPPKSPYEPLWAPHQYLCKVVALYNYHQNKDDELSFQKEEIIYVIKKNSDGWWEGVLRDRTGFFPGNYGKEVI